MRLAGALAIAGVAFSLTAACASSQPPDAATLVSVERVPGNGAVADLVVGPTGTVHLVSVEGNAEAGDVMYRHRASNEDTWSAPLRVNATPGAALAIGTIRGPRVAEGRRGQVYVLWNGSSKVTTDQQRGSPLLFARIDAGRVGAARNLMTKSTMLDGGGAIAADQAGHVYAMWHGLLPPHQLDADRTAFLSVSDDDGVTFEAERVVSPAGSGACGCCGMAAAVVKDTGLLWLFRAATGDHARDMMIMRRESDASSVLLRDPWELQECPLSTSAIGLGPRGAVAAWETRGQILTSDISEGKASPATPVRGTGQRRYPAVALNSAGDTLLAWTEGAAWARGGDLAWVLLEHGNRRELASGTASKLPPWTKPAAYARPDGTFVILH